ncbi:MAG: response regulator transcription factor [Clostridia bacterium]|jgi:DNA-binding response OmpR family regulator|nr:response regulator transcription factor [Clostridia bacterium]
MTKILIADDEVLIRRLVCDFLKKSGYETVEATDGRDAIVKFAENKDVKLIICDIMMPEMDGWEVCKKIRETSNVPIIVLTARAQEFDELASFESGADDYVTKPFSPSVLVKRVEALLKRSESSKRPDSSDVVKEDGLTVNIAAHTVDLDGSAVELTKKEYDILVKLIKNPNRIYSREMLLDDIWGIDFDGDARAVDSHVARLRTKLGAWGDSHLKTVYGVGYKIEVSES